jgi:hypothetical protein
MFSVCIAEIIADYVAIPRFLDWIHPGPILRQDSLYANPRALEAGLLDCVDPTDVQTAWYLAQNPAAMDIIRANPNVFIYQHSIWRNPAAIEWLLEQKVKINWPNLSANPSPIAIKMLKENPDKIEWPKLSENPGAFDILRENMDKILEPPIHANPLVIEYTKVAIFPDQMSWDALSRNPHPWAIEHLRANWDKINVEYFATNPGIFHYPRDANLVKLLST